MTDFFLELVRRKTQTSAADIVLQSSEIGELAAPEPSADPPQLDVTNAQEVAARRTQQMVLLKATGLFDEAWYLAAHPDIAQAGINAFEHFFDYGYTEGRKPNSYFDPLWYLATYPDVHDTGLQPLFHYAFYGEREGRRPCPLFDPVWYRQHYALQGSENALGHYLQHRVGGAYSPIPEFDAAYYLRTYTDVATANVEAFEHYVGYGYREGRNPSAEFDSKFYTQRYLSGSLDECPLLHYLAHRHEPGVFGRMPDDEVTIPREVKRFSKPGPDFEEFRPLPNSAPRRAKLLAYYLPQFHAFPENDTWWGKGFTEWTNISRGLPRFAGHYQPRVPRDLGFYTLGSNDILRRQAEMARSAGVHGFVFYHYWFNGKRLMESPVDRLLADPSIDLPFCLMWANENWTRRWDGAESEVLIAQNYREDDDERLAADFARHFRDARYIRLQGRPLLMVYRPRLIPNTKETITRWRALFRDRFGEDPILVMAQSFTDTDPDEFGLDGAIEFPPHKLTQNLQPINMELDLLDPEFIGKAYRYDDVVRISTEEPAPTFPLIKTTVPSWDNDARRQGNGLVITGSTPAKYEAWLARLTSIAQERPFFGEPLVCVNAWNEWCEGAYLEPDLHFGAAYLNATGRAITAVARQTATRILLVGHDAFPSGAQQLLLNIGRTLKRCHGAEVEFLLLDGGKLQTAYAEVAPVTVAGNEAVIEAKLRSLHERGFRSAIVNTTAAGRIVGPARTLGIESVLLVHELPRLIMEKGLAVHARAALQAARTVVFAAPFVRDQLLGELKLTADDRMLIRPQGSYKEIERAPAAAAAIREEFGIGADERLVIGVGYADMRKGFDLFLQLWRLLRRERRRTHLCWIGGIDPALREWLAAELSDAAGTGSFHLAGYRDDVAAFFAAADAFVLTSREDPFPTVVLEALSAGVPVVAFDRAGGIPDMLRQHEAGTVVPYCDVPAMASAVTKLVAKPPTDVEVGVRQALVRDEFSFARYARELLTLALPALPSVSVVVPNYNYARFMAERLGSIFRQSHPVHEVIVLDDCSTDNSLPVIAGVAEEWGRDVRLVPNLVNSGSVFAQWRKAAELATGDYVWIAEADDLSDPEFLERTLAVMDGDRSVVLAFADSRTIDHDGAAMWKSYKDYYGTVEAGALSASAVFDASEFVSRFLAVKNLILNVSAVVWRRDALLMALDACQADLRTFKMAGDWRLYLQALAQPGARVAYEAQPLNVHRRHAQSVTHALDAGRHVEEIGRCHAFIRAACCDLPAPVTRAQDAYLAEVTTQLGAAPAAAPAKTASCAPGAAGNRSERRKPGVRGLGRAKA